MNQKIMLIDDEEIILKSLDKDLREEGYDVLTASSGEEAIAKLEEENCDLVVTDLAMPGMDGIVVLKRIKERTPQTGVIILTGFADLTSAIDALRLGADDYLLKPCDSEELIIRIDKCLKKMEALKKVEIYEQILPVCCECGLIRDDSIGGRGKGQWIRGDKYIARKTNTSLSHTYCPSCYEKAIKRLG